VSVEVARHVLWFMGDREHGLPAGKFTEGLLGIIAIADDDNRAKLEAGWPEYVHAFRSVVEDTHGMDALRALARTGRGARGVPCPDCQARPGEACSAPTDRGRRLVGWHHIARMDRASAMDDLVAAFSRKDGAR
jgi:hypothetical protein